jgi:hypothetical protein
MESVFTLGKINRALRNYEDDESITRLDRRLLKGFYIDDKWELVNSSEEESLKFNYKINVGKIKALLKGTNARRASAILRSKEELQHPRQKVHDLKIEAFHLRDSTVMDENTFLSPINNNVLAEEETVKKTEDI